MFIKDPHVEVEQLVPPQGGMLCIIYHDEQGKQETEWKTERRGGLGFVHLVADQKIEAISTSLWTLAKWDFGTTSTSIWGDWDREWNWSREPQQTNWDDRQKITENVPFSVWPTFLEGLDFKPQSFIWYILNYACSKELQKLSKNWYRMHFHVHNLGSDSSWLKSHFSILSISSIWSCVFGHQRKASPNIHFLSAQFLIFVNTVICRPSIQLPKAALCSPAD